MKQTKHYFFGDYVITGIENAFNTKTSYWISKNGYSAAFYCFSAQRPEAVRILDDPAAVHSYIALFDARTQKE